MSSLMTHVLKSIKSTFEISVGSIIKVNDEIVKQIAIISLAVFYYYNSKYK